MSGLLLAGPARAHEGHDHGAPPPPVSTTIAPRADASSDVFELVLIARGEQLTAYLDTFKGNEPIETAEIEVDAAGQTVRLMPDGKGGFGASVPVLARPGQYDLAISVSAAGQSDVLAATLVIPAAAGQATTPDRTSWLVTPAVAREIGERISPRDTAILLTAAVSFLGGLLVMAVVGSRRGTTSTVLLGALLAGLAASDGRAEPATVAARDVAQRFPDGALFVPKPTQRILGIRTIFTAEGAHSRAIELPGRVVPDPNASGLVQASVGGRILPPQGGFKPLGTAVRKGDVLAYVRPPVPSADITQQQQQARELDQQISLVTRKIERLRSVEQVIARSQLEDAQLELRGLHERRANLDRVNRDPEPLEAPVDGIIAASNAVAGQMAEPNSVIFQIMDPARLWVEALSFDPQQIAGEAQGFFAGGRTVTLAYLGTGLADRNQAVPVHFTIGGETSGLRVGQFLTVLAASVDRKSGIAVPREAVLRGANGQSIVYEHTNAERFVPREVRVEPLDAARVLVVAGLDSGRRIVTQGAELLNQIR